MVLTRGDTQQTEHFDPSYKSLQVFARPRAGQSDVHNGELFSSSTRKPISAPRCVQTGLCVLSALVPSWDGKVSSRAGEAWRNAGLRRGRQGFILSSGDAVHPITRQYGQVVSGLGGRCLNSQAAAGWYQINDHMLSARITHAHFCLSWKARPESEEGWAASLCVANAKQAGSSVHSETSQICSSVMRPLKDAFRTTSSRHVP